MTQYGLDINSISITHINNEYVRKGDANPNELFNSVDITEEVLELQTTIPYTIKELEEVQSQEQCPQVDIGPHCTDPYGCDFMAHCWKHVPNNSIFNLSRASGRDCDLYELTSNLSKLPTL